MKRILGVFLALSIVFTNLGGVKNVEAASILSKDKLKNKKIYSVDLDGDGKKEKVMIKHVNDGFKTVKLYINSKLVDEYSELGYASVYICDFNKSDKRKEIYVDLPYSGTGGYIDANILRYKKGKVKTYIYDGRITTYNNKTGEVKIEEGLSTQSSFKSFDKALCGGFKLDNYIKVNKNDITKVSKTSVKTYKKKFAPTATKKITAYTSTSAKTKAFTINKNEEVQFLKVYNSKGKKFVQVKSKNGKTGWVKVGSSQLFY